MDKICGMCDKTNGLCYTSYPPQVKCTITGEFHFYGDSCTCQEGNNGLCSNKSNQ